MWLPCRLSQPRRDKLVRSCPAHDRLPCSMATPAGSTPSAARQVSVLPLPDSPTRPTISPARMLSEFADWPAPCGALMCSHRGAARRARPAGRRGTPDAGAGPGRRGQLGAARSGGPGIVDRHRRLQNQWVRMTGSGTASPQGAAVAEGVSRAFSAPTVMAMSAPGMNGAHGAWAGRRVGGKPPRWGRVAAPMPRKVRNGTASSAAARHRRRGHRDGGQHLPQHARTTCVWRRPSARPPPRWAQACSSVAAGVRKNGANRIPTGTMAWTGPCRARR